MNALPPIHPGEVLLEDFMKLLGLSQYRVAKDIGVSPLRIGEIVHGKRSITADTALRLARYFGTSPTVWLRLQAHYDLEVTEICPQPSCVLSNIGSSSTAARRPDDTYT